MRYEMIAPENLRACWTRVKLGLERILAVSTETWLPEDVYVHLRMKLAQLYLAYNGDEYRGFIVTESKRDNFTNEPYLNVWLLYGEPRTGDHFAEVGMFVDETIGFIDELARGAGITLIRMSGREGWKRFLRGNFKPIRVCYERQLQGVQS
jgi:hypothetical protein